MSSFDCEVIVIGGGVGELAPRELDVTDQSAVLAAGHEFLPDADVVQADAYNWKGETSLRRGSGRTPGRANSCDLDWPLRNPKERFYSSERILHQAGRDGSTGDREWPLRGASGA